MLGAWMVTSAIMTGAFWVGRKIFALDISAERRQVLGEVAHRLQLPPPKSGQAELTWQTPGGLEVRAHATPHLELRMRLPDWVPADLAVDTVAPPIRGLQHLVPDPRFLEWVSSSDRAELLGVLDPVVRDTLLEAHHFGPGHGISLRDGGLEVALPWRDVGELDRTVARMERIALRLHARPAALPKRLAESVLSDDRREIRQASLRALLARFPLHKETTRAMAHADAEGLVQKALPSKVRRIQQGWLTLLPKDPRGQLSDPREDDEAA